MVFKLRAKSNELGKGELQSLDHALNQFGGSDKDQIIVLFEKEGSLFFIFRHFLNKFVTDDRSPRDKGKTIIHELGWSAGFYQPTSINWKDRLDNLLRSRAVFLGEVQEDSLHAVISLQKLIMGQHEQIFVQWFSVEASNQEANTIIDLESWSALQNLVAFIDGLGSFVLQTMQGEEVNDDDINVLESSFAQLFVSLVDGFSQVVAERDSDNDASRELMPAVTPQGLVRMRRAEFAAITMRFKARMERSGLNEEVVERIEAD